MKTTVGKFDITIIEDKNYGYFEHSGMEIEGGLWFDGDKKLEDYDGVIFLPDEVIEGIEKLGYKVPDDTKELHRD